jgi:nucleoid-associated protein YgaU
MGIMSLFKEAGEKLFGRKDTEAAAAAANQKAASAIEADESQYHTVVRGDTLSAIAKTHYGNAGAYMKTFEANRPMLGHPDKIYPGQLLRIPA